MTDWVVAVITKSPGKVEEDKKWEVAKNRVGRNDRLGSGLGERGRKAEARKREEVAKGRGPERPIESERWRRSRKMVTEEARRVGEPEKRLPRTEWAGMTDWVQVQGKPNEKGGGQRQGRARKLPKTEWAGMTD